MSGTPEGAESGATWERGRPARNGPKAHRTRRTQASHPQARAGGPPPEARHLAIAGGTPASARTCRSPNTWIPACAGMTALRVRE